MVFDHVRAGVIAVVAIVALGCTGGNDLLAPDGTGTDLGLEAEVLGMHSVRVRWEALSGGTARLERRANLQGPFAAITGDLPRTQTSYVDITLQPATFYGYRLVVYDAFGKQQSISPVVGVHTPPPPSIKVRVTSEPPTAPSADADGYTLTITGPADTTTLPVDPNSVTNFSPLLAGDYVLRLSGLAPQCVPADSLVRHVTVTDQGTATLQEVSIAVQCRNPERAQIAATVSVSGDLPDPNGFQLELAGIASDNKLPDTARAVLQTQTIGAQGGTAAFTDIRPGKYTVTIGGLAPNCKVIGTVPGQFEVVALDDVTKSFTVDCPDPTAANRPFALRADWVPAVASPGAAVTLDLTLDLTARPSQNVAAFDGEVRTASTVLRYDSTTARDLPTVVANPSQPGLLILGGFTTGAGISGVVHLARVWYTVIGSNSQTTTTQITHSNIATDNSEKFDTEVRTVQGTFTVGTPTGGNTNQAPVAKANGPYSGTAGAPITFSSAGSNDPDGTIASYAWTFGDGASGTGPSPTHAYAAAGTYTATLTVTDNLGTTGTAQGQVTVTAGSSGGGGACGSGTITQPFVLCNTWTPTSAASGMKVMLTQTLDLSAQPSQDLVAFESSITTDAAVMRFDSARARDIPSLVVNSATPGLVRLAGFVTGAGPTGQVVTARVYYTVIGSTGSMTTQTTIANFVGTSGDPLVPKIKVVEGTLAISSIGSGNPSGPPPTDPGPGNTASLDWRSSFGAPDVQTRLVPLTLALDTSRDPSVSVDSWQVDSLKWDPGVLSYASTDFGAGTGSVDASRALQGKLILGGIPNASAAEQQPTLAVVRFAAYAPSGRSTATVTALGAVSGHTAASPVDLMPRVVVHEASFTTP